MLARLESLPTPAQPDVATALLIDIPEKSEWAEEMEEAAPNEEFIERTVRRM